jgi:hypothetical protein
LTFNPLCVETGQFADFGGIRLMSSRFHGSCVLSGRAAPETTTPLTMPGASAMTTSQPTKPKLKAEAAYENAHLVARDLLERIEELLFDMPPPGDEDHPIDWANVGDVNEVNRQLLEVIAFLSNQD